MDPLNKTHVLFDKQQNLGYNYIWIKKILFNLTVLIWDVVPEKYL